VVSWTRLVRRAFKSAMNEMPVGALIGLIAVLIK